MKRLPIFLIAPIFAGVVYLLNQNLDGIIAVICIMVLGIGLPLLVSSLDKIDIQGAFTALVGALFSLAAVGIAHRIFQDIPSSITLVLYAVIVSISAVIFQIFQEKEGFNWLKAKEAEPLPPVEVDERVYKMVKILDTSIVIDGRIIDLASTGFVEGPFVVPNFVLRELQLISDSPDAIKRNRGRRGLDMLNSLQKRDDLEVQISYKDYTETREVDAKLVRLAKDLKGKLITNDFNLNKVAELQGIEVLNINNLANALKPVVLPGEEMELQVVKEGKDENQGIGYLDDGTMVVIENGGKLLGKKVRVNVTSIIQTNAGKMIFTKVTSRN